MIENEFRAEAADTLGAAGAAPGPAPRTTRPAPTTRRINLALQGGGTHGAFTWGVLERLLEDERLEFEAVSGTSAGAMNAAVFVQGLCEGGRDGARRALERFWRNAASRMSMSPLQNTPLEKALWGHDLTWSFAYQTFETLTRVMSPYQLNPTPYEFNPLRQVLEEEIHPEILRHGKGPKLFISATSVRTGKPRVFAREEVTVDTLLASACLPQFFKAVEIDGEPFWDGGYLGNPALWPLYEQGGPPDIVLVQLNPIVRDELPTRPTEIVNRLNEISFNASLMAEMRAIDFVQRLLEAGRLEQPRYRKLFVHCIEDEARMRDFKLSTKLNGDWDFLMTLKRYGREAADGWIAAHFDKLGRESSVDIRERFL
ncbi:patatin-like phospholipase family protein [Falsiroseomonas tokyonensis]|uniref:Patatin-like phospholipase family protein n=1 Tax=Falsiroseomonas tokyonensis TaxID=430521 RepID=A0ABV7BQY2_9PROT|nr:patatin-like phospholipase family protein [Falsiroseomonas tokyonensis]MBU8537432.1 patatin-like phospholipase family protein [Falsiroseomonas tokyonensis]